MDVRDRGETIREKADRLRSFHFFRDCPDDFFLALAAITETRFFPTDAHLIQEGQANDSLFFLLTGAVDVLVLGERVARLEQPGELLGEMSVITSLPASATILALSPVSVYAIPANRLENLISTSQNGFGQYLYRTYAWILSERMLLTNDKARRFEMANRALVSAIQALEEANRTLDGKVRERTEDLERKTRELALTNSNLETKNTELLASHRKLEELYTSKDLTFSTLTELSHSYLSPLETTLREMETRASSADRSRIQLALAQVASSQGMLRPLAALYSTERAMRSRRVLLVESEKKNQVVAKLALGGTGVQLDIVRDEDELAAFLESGVKIDVAFVSPDIAASAARIPLSHPSAKLVFMASSDIPSFLPTLRDHPIYTNIVSRDVEDRTFTVKNIVTTVTKLLSADLFGLEKYLIWGVETHSREVACSDARGDLIEEMRECFSGLGVRSRISDRAALVAEEMLMNAIYDAPLTLDGKPRYNHLPRTQCVKLEEREKGEFRYACDGMLAAVSVSDPFGGFQLKTLLTYLERNYAGGENPQETRGRGGAGRGLHQIVENSDLLIINVRPKFRTEMIALFNLDPQAKEHEGRPSLHYFQD